MTPGEKRRRNAARLARCPLHDFDWRAAIAKQMNRRAAVQERYGITVNVRAQWFCRCKNCGGKIAVEYAGAYMDGVRDARRAMQREEGGAHG